MTILHKRIYPGTRYLFIKTHMFKVTELHFLIGSKGVKVTGIRVNENQPFLMFKWSKVKDMIV